MGSNREDPIGVFDSGVGGISTLGAMAHLLPGENFIYYGDTRNAPYGTKSTDEVIHCVREVTAQLLEEHIKALVIACNTATGAAAATLRRELTLPVIGMEPALKPAWEAHRNGSILVLATPLTLRQEKFTVLMEKYGEHACTLPCEGLMELVENEDDRAAEIYLRKLFSEWKEDEISAVVLGCTHYVFLKPMIQAMLPPHVLITDGNGGTARQLKRVLEGHMLLSERAKGSIVLKTSGQEEKTIPVMKRLLNRAFQLAEGAL